MAKNLSITILLDFYGQLLTDKQISALNMYYNEDFSLSEIAEETGISRQGVHDNIKRGEHLLYEYEDKLGLAKRFLRIKTGIKRLNEIIDTLNTQGNEDKIRELKELSDKLSLEI